MRSFDLDTRSEGSVTVVSVAGSVDAVTAPRLGDALGAALAAGQVHLVVDLAGVGYVSSAALRALLAGVKGARSGGGDLRLAAVGPDVGKVFEMAGFDGIIQRFDDTAAAVASFD
ncbi:MAG: anti-sigma factor antagonist [Trueperaceae bacterium]|nr:MAG: anti-sigma factor antagonist [Trueperaceae bacterium]